MKNITPRMRKVVKLAGEGWSPAEIARHMGMARAKTVSVYLTEARRLGVPGTPEPYDIGSGALDGVRIDRLPPATAAQLRIEAEARGLPATVLARQVLAAVVNGDLFAAVLDR